MSIPSNNITIINILQIATQENVNGYPNPKPFDYNMIFCTEFNASIFRFVRILSKSPDVTVLIAMNACKSGHCAFNNNCFLVSYYYI